MFPLGWTSSLFKYASHILCCQHLESIENAGNLYVICGLKYLTSLFSLDFAFIYHVCLILLLFSVPIFWHLMM